MWMLQKTKDALNNTKEALNNSTVDSFKQSSSSFLTNVASKVHNAKTAFEDSIPDTVKNDVNATFSSEDSVSMENFSQQPPWVCQTEAGKLYQAEIKEKVFKLTQQNFQELKALFLSPPAAAASFPFDLEKQLPSCMAALKEDPNLEKIRFVLVPQQIQEEEFFRIYFFSVDNIIRSFCDLTNLTTETATSGATAAATSTTDNSLEDEFISDVVLDSTVDDSVRSKLQEELGLNSTTNASNVDSWEEELKAELDGLDFDASTLPASGAVGDDDEDPFADM